jgi:hypothetical protein
MNPTQDRDDEPKTVYEYERRRQKLEPGAVATGGYPRLPPSSPWATGIDQVSGVEPPIDRTEDQS